MRPSGGVFLYFADPASFIPCAGSLREALSGEERERERRFRLPEEREIYAVSRGLLRRILGWHAGTDPRDILLSKGPWGKPVMAPGTNPGDIRFSVSRTDRCLLFAVARGREVGADVETIRDDFPWAGIVDGYFAPREADRIRALPERERAAAFFTCWTLKEAFMKGTGKGFSLPMDRFEVSWDPPGLKSVAEDPGAAAKWSLGTFEPEPGCAASLAVEGPFPSVRLHALRSGTRSATGFYTSAKRVYCR